MLKVHAKRQNYLNCHGAFLLCCSMGYTNRWLVILLYSCTPYHLNVQRCMSNFNTDFKNRNGSFEWLNSCTQISLCKSLQGNKSMWQSIFMGYICQIWIPCGNCQMICEVFIMHWHGLCGCHHTFVHLWCSKCKKYINFLYLTTIDSISML